MKKNKNNHDTVIAYCQEMTKFIIDKPFGRHLCSTYVYICYTATSKHYTIQSLICLIDCPPPRAHTHDLSLESQEGLVFVS